MIVICVEGCHGSGKSELCRYLQKMGFPVLDEGFIDMPNFSLHPQTFTMESIWVSNWIQRVLQRQEEDKHKSNAIYFVDRSPLSAIFYAKKNGHLLEPTIREQFRELAGLADIHIYTVCIRVERELLWSRIQQRLAREPGRHMFNEGSRQWMEKTLSFYDNMQWDFEIDNNVQTIPELAHKLLQQLCGDVKNFKESYNGGAELIPQISPHASPVKVGCH